MSRSLPLLRGVRALLVLALLGALGLAAAQAAPTAALRPALSGEQRTLSLPGFGAVAYTADPRGTGRPLVLLHSVNAAASAYEMKPLWDAYAGSRPLYALEWPGFGRSGRPDVPYTPALMVSALRALLDTLGTEVDVVALSLGSEFAARAALADPRIRRLALISPTGLGRARGEPNPNTGRALRAVSGPLYSALRTRPSIEYFLSRSFRGPVDDGLLAYALETSRQPGAVYGPLAFLSGVLFTPDAYGDLYARLSVPVLVLYDQDAFTSFERLPELLGRPGVQAVRIEGTDGLPQFDRPGEVKAALDRFWSEAETR
ncbi:alpha/beta fold hydrolase [Deinococcus multiflagellatus]|uniref:alpha/beta fold hydrolase n=1 Tax=Deinococcus multiflagellatus TaxID=1656887 RepID=UPI001CC9D0CE|nr:alpha/beta fold hydrolase [Deinococcus multiflagellatus]MBZ9712099.1 alpha/beta fold hydrolase [Deinococcus multiflagellatus]